MDTAHLLDAREQLPRIGLRRAWRLRDFHLVAVVCIVEEVVAHFLGEGVVLLGIVVILRDVGILRAVVVKVDHLVAIVQAIVGLGCRRLVLCCSYCIGLDLDEGIGGEVVKIGVGEVKVVFIHCGSIGRPPTSCDVDVVLMFQFMMITGKGASRCLAASFSHAGRSLSLALATQ